MNRVAVYPGSFDPITMGHVDIIERLSKAFEKVIVLVADSSQKQGLFSAQERKKLIQETLKKLKNVEVDISSGLTVDYVRKVKAHVIVRGLRAISDFEYEMTMANMNRKLAPEIETLMVFAAPEYYYISSRGVKEVAMNGGALEGLVSDHVGKAMKKKMKEA